MPMLSTSLCKSKQMEIRLSWGSSIRGKAAELTFLRQTKSGILQTLFSLYAPCTTQILHIWTVRKVTVT